MKWTEKIQAYSILYSLDESILKLNPYIEKFGFEFCIYSLDEMEKEFGSLFYFSGEDNIRIDLGNGKDISSDLYHQIQQNFPHGFFFCFRRQFIMLRSKNIIEVEFDGAKDVGPDTVAINELTTFLQPLITQLRLFKDGEVGIILCFTKDLNTNHVTSRLSYGSQFIGSQLYSLSDEEAKNLGGSLKEKIPSNTLIELPIENFNVSYGIKDVKTKFTTLMVALEGIFSFGGSQVSHVVSRHAALILSNSSKELQDNYERIKKLYKLRSNIVHGSRSSEKEANEKLNELKLLVRFSISYCIANKHQDGKKLFEILNAKGF